METKEKRIKLDKPKAFESGINIKGKVCVITGASSGIGLEYCRVFAEAGASVVCMISRNIEKLQNVSAKLQEDLVGEVFWVYQADLSIQSEVEKVISTIQRDHSRIDLFVANAGIYNRSPGLEAWSKEDFDETFSINTMHLLHSINLVLPIFQMQKQGCFVVSSSACGLFSILDDLNYNISKAAAVSIAEYLAIKYGSKGINTVCVCTKTVDTPLNRVNGVLQYNKELSPRILLPRQVAMKVRECIQNGSFMVLLPEKELKNPLMERALDYDVWLKSAIKFHDKCMGQK
eukprot:augustus_masked-scaffold_12-processed-gene-12.78-mRNA-1 protein AED:1.00 eAED:1.00 QI:0/-1/0/0/-1/1/1/0/288